MAQTQGFRCRSQHYYRVSRRELEGVDGRSLIADVTLLLNDDEWSAWSDREIARRCAVSQPFVSKMRPVTDNGYQSEPEQPRTYTTKHGTTYTQNTANIGRKNGGRIVVDAAPFTA